MENSPLKKLAPELSNEIYEMVLTAPNPISCRFQGSDQSWICDLKYTSGNLLTITETCREISEECKQMFWDLNEFEVRIYADEIPLKLEAFREFLGASAAINLHHVTVDVGSLRCFGNNPRSPPISMIMVNLPLAIKAILDEAEDHPQCHFELKFAFRVVDYDQVCYLDTLDFRASWDAILTAMRPGVLWCLPTGGDRWLQHLYHIVEHELH